MHHVSGALYRLHLRASGKRMLVQHDMLDMTFYHASHR